MKKRLLSILLVISLIVCSVNVAFADDNELAYDLSLARLNAAYNYLNAEYLNSNLGLYIEYGTLKDFETLQKLADSITEDIFSDEDKCIAIYDWMVENIKAGYSDAYAPIDVFRIQKAICSGHANLMATLMRMSGITASIVRGYHGAMTTKTLSEIYDGDCATHQWVMAYINDDWYLFDDLWDQCLNNNREEIASKYYVLNVDGVSAYTEEMDTTVDEFTYPETIYKDGEWYGFRDGELLLDTSAASLSMGGCLKYQKLYYHSAFNSYYKSLDNAINTEYGYAIKSGYYSNLNGKANGNIYFVKENGILLNSTSVNYNDNIIFLNGQSSITIDESIDNNGLNDGCLNMYIGETIDFTNLYNDNTIAIVLSGKDNLSVDGLKITALKEGKSNIKIAENGTGGTLIINVYGDAIKSKDLFKLYCNHEETHIGTDDCEYCDYCGKLIEQEIVEETINEEVIEDEIVEETTPTDLAINEEEEIVDDVINEEIVDETTEEEIIETTPTDLEETIVEETINNDLEEEIIEEEIIEEEEQEEIVEDVIETPTETISNDYTPIIESEEQENAQEVEEQYITVYLTFIGNVEDLDIDELLNNEDFINSLIDFIQTILIDNVYEYSIIVFII